MAAAFLIIAMDFINLGPTNTSPILKYFFDLSVDAPQYLSTGTFIEPMLSYSFLNFIVLILRVYLITYTLKNNKII